MSIHIKSEKEIKVMRESGRILGDVLHKVVKSVKPGVTELELDHMAERLIREAGGESGFKKVEGYVHTICASTNDVVVHGIPQKRALRENDVIGIDCGVYFDGFHTDMAETVRVRTQNSELRTQKDEVDKFLEVGEYALFEAIKQAKPGNRVGHISKTIQDIVEKEHRYSIVRGLVGHGVGRELHEEPEIPGYLDKPIEKTTLLKSGMTIAIEVIYNMGKRDVYLDSDDKWTILTEDGSISGVFERTILVTENEPQLVTAFPGEKI